MSKSDDLIAARRHHVASLQEAGARAYPNLYAGDDTARRHAFDLARDPAQRAALPVETELADDAASYPLYGRVIAKRGPFLVIRTRHGDDPPITWPLQAL